MQIKAIIGFDRTLVKARSAFYSNYYGVSKDIVCQHTWTNVALFSTNIKEDKEKGADVTTSKIELTDKKKKKATKEEEKPYQSSIKQ